MTWLSGWSYRKEISITGQSGAGTDYQVEFDIGDSAGGDFHLEGNCTSFPQDIAVTDNDETTLLDFWIEDITADPIKMWVEVADDLGSNQTIYVYYGKGESPTGSSIENTFLLGDDFPGSSVDGEKWTSSGATVASSEVTLNAQNEFIQSIATFGQNHAVRCRIKSVDWNAANSNSIYGFRIAGTSGAVQTMSNYPVATSHQILNQSDAGANTGSGALTEPTGNTYYIMELRRNANTNTLYYRDNALIATISSNMPTINLSVGIISEGSDAQTMISDWILVRKYNPTEPAFSSAGSEETPPVTGNPYWYYQMLKRRN